MAFVDLAEAIDTISRDWPLKIMAILHCSHRFIAMVRQCHDVMQALVPNGKGYSEPFTVINGG